MKHVQPDALLEQAIDIRAARTLCRDGWSCEQINAVLQNTEISHEQFETIQSQSRELDKLQKIFGAPIDSLQDGHAEPNKGEIAFLNRGPDAAASVLRAKGWNNHEITLVIKESMFVPLEEPTSDWLSNQIAYNSYEPKPPATAAYGGNGYPRGGYPGTSNNFAATRAVPRRTARGSLGRDIFILTFMATVALVMVFTLL
ncbi:MAG: hypothetical protein AAGI69_04910 [Cyanobacteria bacterium P01_H01_bin.21]